MSIAPAALLNAAFRWGSSGGAPSGRANGTRYGASASAVTTQGEIVVANPLASSRPGERAS